MISIKVEGLSKIYWRNKVLSDINFKSDKPEVIGLCGVNGAGKSTLMKSICGILSIDHGQIFINDLSVEDNKLSIKKSIGFLAEHNPLYQDLFVLEYLRFVANIRSISYDLVDQAIVKVGLQDKVDQQIKILSKGYKQRVGLAQAILGNPDILILDEPTSGLDPNQIIEIRNLIKELGKNKIVLLSSHMMHEVSFICNRVIFIHNGKLIKDQPLEEIKEQFTSIEEAFQVYSRGL